MNYKVLIACLFSAMLTACSSTSHVLIGTPRAPIDPSQVKIYTIPPKDFEQIAIIEASSKDSWAVGDQQKLEKAIERLKEQAAELGANGIIFQGSDSSTTGVIVNGYNYNSTGQFNATAVPIKHKSVSGTAIYTSSGSSCKSSLTSIGCQ